MELRHWLPLLLLQRSQPASDGLLAQQQHRRRLTATSSLAKASQGSSPLHYFRARSGGAAALVGASRLRETAPFLRLLLLLLSRHWSHCQC